MGRTHIGTQMKNSVRCQNRSAQLKNASCRCLGIDDDQATPAALHFDCCQFSHFLIGPATDFASVIHRNPLERLEQFPDIWHQLRLWRQADGAFGWIDAVQQRLRGGA